MNWRKIEENWQAFVKKNILTEDSAENNYFHGKQELYRASENFQGFMIYYDNKFNKSAAAVSSSHIGNRFTIVSPIEVSQKARMIAEKNSLRKRLLRSGEKWKMEFTDPEFLELLPLKEMEMVSSFFSDLKLSIKEFGKHQNKQIAHRQKVLAVETKCQPEELQYLQKSRDLMTATLKKLYDAKKIKPI